MSTESTLSRLKQDLIARLSSAGIPNPQRDILTLLQHVSGATAAGILADTVQLTTRQTAHLLKLVDRRAAREPLQYILGKWPFWKHAFILTSDVLIPRPETEHILEILLQAIPRDHNGTLVDCCTGSGCLAISAAFERPSLTITACDISLPALLVAEENRKQLNCRPIQWVCSDMLNAFRCSTVDVIIANPPYVATDSAPDLEPELAHEPSIALFSGETGMDHIHRLLFMSGRILKKGGMLIFEFGYNQGEVVRHAVRSNTDRAVRLKIVNDLRGVERIAVVEFI